MKIYVKSSTDNSEKWVIVCKETKHDTNQLFIAPQKYSHFYLPTWTSTGRRNYDRAKLFKSKEEALAYVEKQNKEKKLFTTLEQDFSKKGIHQNERPTNIEVMPYSEAMEVIGDPEQNYKDYKQKQADNKKAYRERNKDAEKARREKNKAKDPGRYKVWFYYANSWLGAESFIVDAESIDDAFKKAKAEALRQDGYRDTQGYDERMIFNKNNIKKIS